MRWVAQGEMAASQVVVAVLKNRSERSKVEKLASMSRTANASLLRKSGTEQVRQGLRGPKAVQIYRFNEPRDSN